MNYYPRHIGDYVSATAHLSMAEDGAYTRLLDWYYQDERPIPADKRLIYRRVRASSRPERQAVDAVLAEFFQEAGDGFRHSRCDAEIERAQEKSNKARKSAAQRWQSDGNANAYANAPPDAMRTHSEGNALQEPIANSQQPIANSQSSERSSSESSTRLPAGVDDAEKPASADPPPFALNGSPEGPRAAPPDCPAEQVVELFHEVLPELPRIERLTDTRRAHIRQRWKEWAVEKGWRTRAEGLEEWRRFFAYVRSSEFLMGRSKPREQGKKPFVATLEWLMKPANHVKVFEGNYHD